jgi:hypothetical protein
MQITSGKIPSALKVVVYGPEGIGKSTFAAQFPEPIFCDTEGSTKHMDVRRTPKPTSWAMILEQVRYFIQHPNLLKTFVLDTADWAEQMCTEALCAKSQKTGIEDFGYGKGYIYLGEEFGRLLNLLEELIGRGVNVVVTAHAKMRKFEQPDEMGAYDRWEMKLSKTCAPLLKEWADAVLFANYKTLVINVDGQGTAKGKNKAQGGQRVMRTTHHPCWDAKNRFSLPEKLPFDFKGIAHLFPAAGIPATPPASAPQTSSAPPKQEPRQESVPERPTAPSALQRAIDAAVTPFPATAPTEGNRPPGTEPPISPLDPSIPKALRDLMEMNGIQEWEIQGIVGEKGYFPHDMPIRDYPADFIEGWALACWPQVLETALANRDKTPF